MKDEKRLDLNLLLKDYFKCDLLVTNFFKCGEDKNEIAFRSLYDFFDSEGINAHTEMINFNENKFWVHNIVSNLKYGNARFKTRRESEIDMFKLCFYNLDNKLNPIPEYYDGYAIPF